VLTTERDPAGRPTIYDRLPKDLPRLIPVGRLDLNTEGLLLLTTDGELKRQLELPATGVERTYRARAYGAISQAQLEELIDGVEIEGMRYGKIDANLERRTGANVWIEMTLTEGKNREVRRVLEHLGLSVSRLIRTRYGPFVLGDLPAGEIGEVRQHDLVAFRQTLGKPAALRPPMEQVAATRTPRGAAPAAARQPVRLKPSAPRSIAPRKREQREEIDTRPARVRRPVDAKPVAAPAKAAAAPPAPTAAPKPKRGAGWARAKPKPGRKPRSKPPAAR
jgi:23S rRNA pseudouridine2605 synthase